jgi:hypothetical protein
MVHFTLALAIGVLAPGGSQPSSPAPACPCEQCARLNYAPVAGTQPMQWAVPPVVPPPSPAKVKLEIANVRGEAALLFVLDGGQLTFKSKLPHGEGVDLDAVPGQRWVAVFSDKPGSLSFTVTPGKPSWVLRKADAPACCTAPANPLSIRGGLSDYTRVFEVALRVLATDFPIAYANRYDGRIETSSIKGRRAVVAITAREDGYTIDVRVLRGPKGAGRDAAAEQEILRRVARLGAGGR